MTSCRTCKRKVESISMPGSRCHDCEVEFLEEVQEWIEYQRNEQVDASREPILPAFIWKALADRWAALHWQLRRRLESLKREAVGDTKPQESEETDDRGSA